MPSYDYHCAACGATFQAEHRMSDPPVTVCAACGKEGSVSRWIGQNSNFILKGSGWYASDYKKGGSEPPKNETDAKKSEAAKSEDATSADTPKKADAAPTAEPAKTESAKATETKPAESKPAAPAPTTKP